MSHALKVKAFFFNSKTDYLPYYKHFSLKLDADATAKDMLLSIQEQNENFSFPKQKLLMRINGLVVEAKQPLSILVERLGTTLQIDPVNSYRSNDGLKINDDDFMQSYALLAPYTSPSDEKYYKTLYALHYASESSNFDRAYIGDAILILAHKMISEGSEHKVAILSAISSAHSGLFDCEYENNLFNAETHSAAITALKEMATSSDDEHPSLLDMLKNRFCKDKEEKTVQAPKRIKKTIEGIENKHIAHYVGTASSERTHTLLKELDITEIHFSRATKLSGLRILKQSKDLALKKAGATLLDAYDSAVEVLLVEDLATYEMFEKHFSGIEKIIGRKMIGLDIIYAEDFLAQTSLVEA